MKRLSTVLYLTLVVAFVEFLGAYLSNSISLASDGVHMLGDVGGIGLAWIIGWRVAHQKENRFKSERLEMSGAYMNGILLAVVSLGIAASAIWRLSHPPEIKAGIMMGVAGAGLAVNLVSLFLLGNLQKRNLNIRGAYQHILGDAAASVGVVVAALLIHWTGSTLIDPLVGIGVACFVIWRAKDLIRDARQALVASRAREAREEQEFREAQERREVQEIGDIWELVRSLAAYNHVHGLCVIGRENGTTWVAFHLVMIRGRHPGKVIKRVTDGLVNRGVEAVITLCRGRHCR